MTIILVINDGASIKIYALNGRWAWIISFAFCLDHAGNLMGLSRTRLVISERVAGLDARFKVPRKVYGRTANASASVWQRFTSTKGRSIPL